MKLSKEFDQNSRTGMVTMVPQPLPSCSIDFISFLVKDLEAQRGTTYLKVQRYDGHATTDIVNVNEDSKQLSLPISTTKAGPIMYLSIEMSRAPFMKKGVRDLYCNAWKRYIQLVKDEQVEHTKMLNELFDKTAEENIPLDIANLIHEFRDPNEKMEAIVQSINCQQKKYDSPSLLTASPITIDDVENFPPLATTPSPFVAGKPFNNNAFNQFSPHEFAWHVPSIRACSAVGCLAFSDRVVAPEYSSSTSGINLSKSPLFEDPSKFTSLYEYTSPLDGLNRMVKGVSAIISKV
ncbi:MAG: hypothetical protein WBQ73_03725 [Candidatus Babeliales bacterium]